MTKPLNLSRNDRRTSIVLPASSQPHEPPITAQVTWSLLASSQRTQVAQCRLEVTAPHGFAVKVYKVEPLKKKSLLVRCTAMQGGYSGRFVLTPNTSALISVDKKAQYDIEIVMYTAQLVFHADSEETYLKVIQTWENIDVRLVQEES